MSETIQVPEQTRRTVLHLGGYPTVCFWKMSIDEMCKEVEQHNEHIKSVQVTFIWYNLRGWPMRETHYLNVREKFMYD